MLLLLFYWSYLGFSFLNLGIGFQKMTQIKTKDHILLAVFGMFTATMLASFWAIFGRINTEFQFFLIALQCCIIALFRKEWYSVYQSFWSQMKALLGKLKILLGIILFFTLVHSVSDSRFIDNETYYIQTIKWLNEYGFVKGLANLHIFFGQTSGWHILQSAFSFSYVSNQWNHLNGFCLLLGNVFALFQLNDYFKSGNRQQLWIGLLPIVNVILLFFCKVPAPSLAVAILLLILFHHFVKYFDQNNIENFNIILLLAGFIIYIKVTALPTLVFPLCLLIMDFKKIISKPAWSVVIGLSIFGVFIIKNSILTGYPLFPSPLFKSYGNIDFAVPDGLYDFSFNRRKYYDFFISAQDYFESNVFEIFWKWMSNSVVNSFIVVLIMIIPFCIKRFFNQQAYWILYAAMLLQFLFLWMTSPQYRFFIPFILIFGLILVSVFIKNKKAVYFVVYSSFSVALLLLFLSPKLGQHQKKLTFNRHSFSWSRLVYPRQNSNLKTTYHSDKIGNLRYFSPDTTAYIWVTGGGKLPCVNSKQIEYFNEKIHCIPQLRTSKIEDGFYSKKTTP